MSHCSTCLQHSTANTESSAYISTRSIHFNRGFPAALKQIYDFLSVEVWFTSSAALAMEQSAWDLSRRVRSCYLRAFTLGEYMHFAEGIEVARLPLSRLFGAGPPAEHLRYGYHFDRFLDGGLYPFTLESGLDLEPFRSMIEKIVSTDIPSVSPSLSHDDLTRIRKVLAFIGTSPIDGVNYSSISRNTGITKYKAEQYLELLERAFLVRRAFPAGTNVLKEPKVFLEPPYRLLYRDRDACIGELREDFFALAMAQHERPFSYAKSTRGSKTPDFLIEIDGESIVAEVGGRGKGRSQFKGIEYRRKVVLFHDSPAAPAQRAGRHERPVTHDRLPLHLIGFA